MKSSTATTTRLIYFPARSIKLTFLALTGVALSSLVSPAKAGEWYIDRNCEGKVFQNATRDGQVEAHTDDYYWYHYWTGTTPNWWSAFLNGPEFYAPGDSFDFNFDLKHTGTLEWHTDDPEQDPPPTSVILLQRCTATYDMEYYSPFPLNINDYVSASGAESYGVLMVNDEYNAGGMSRATIIASSPIHTISLSNSGRNTSISLPATDMQIAGTFKKLPADCYWAVDDGGLITSQYAIPVPSLGVRRKGSNSGFGAGATIAAGGFGTDEHKAEVQLSFGSNFAGMDAADFMPKLLYGDGYKGPDAVFTPSGNTVLDGGGNAIIGTVTSSNVTTEASPPIQLVLPERYFSPPPTASLNQAWDQLRQWSLGAEGENFTPGYLNYGETTMTFSPKLSDGTPIREHTMDFFADDVWVTEWNEALGIYVESVKTVGDEELGDGETRGTEEYAQFNPPSAGGPDHTTTMKVEYDARKLVQTVAPVAEDHITYHSIQ